MPKRFVFDAPILETVVGGKSVLDMPRLNFKTLAEVDAFLIGYGFEGERTAEKMWHFHRRALVLLQEKLGFSIDAIPEVLREPKLLEDPRKLLLYASSDDPAHKDLQRWSCALLRAMHVFVHIENDLFSFFSEEIQGQILTPFQSRVFHDGVTGKTFFKRADGSPHHEETLQLLAFETKPFKTSSSAVIKLLAKSDALALNIYDKVGVRFVASSMFDCYRLIRFLIQENLISFPHIIPDQSSNNLYPSDIFLAATHEILKEKIELTEQNIEAFFTQFYEKNKDSAAIVRKENFFSGADYKFIKFISRKLIHVQMPGQQQGFSFFYPFEVQIMDKSAHENILSGPSHHQAYKERQRNAARNRLLPEPQE